MCARSEGSAGGIEGEVVAAEDEEVGDLDGLGEGLASLLDVRGVLEDLSLLEVFEGGDGVAADECGVTGLFEEEPGESGRDSREREEGDVGRGAIGRGLAALEDGDVALEGGAELVIVVLCGFAERVCEGDADGLAFGFGDEPLGGVEGLDAAPEVGAEGGEEDVGDGGGLEVGAFLETGEEELGWE